MIHPLHPNNIIYETKIVIKIDNDFTFRYIAIMKPLHYHQVMSVKVFRAMSATLWIFVLVVGLILPTVWHEHWSSNPLRKCDFVPILK